MDKVQIVGLLEQKHQDIFNWLDNQPEENWEKGPVDKWTTGQHILHLVKSLQMLNKALSYPKFILKYKFGVCNRAPRDYATVAKKYQDKLDVSKDKAKEFNKSLQIPTIKDKKRLLTRYQIQQKKLQYKTQKISDKNLDSLIVPHPLMGKMTLREIIMWTAHHTEHHLQTLQNFY